MSESSEPPISILHVDDDPDFADLTAEFLEEANDRFSVETATGTEEGLAALEGQRFDCVVSDYDMPGRNGIDFLEAVREEYPRLPFILYTGKGSEEVASEAISAGLTDYLQKGSGTDQYTVLANRITNAVEHHRSQRTLAERTQALQSYERMVNSMNEAACIYDEDGRFALVNEYLAEWYGVTRDELEGQQSNLVTHVRDQAEGDPFCALFDGDRADVSGTVEAEFSDHGYAVIEYQLTPLKVDEAVEGVVGVARDVTERTERKRELEQTNTLLSTLFDTLPQGVVVEDESRNVLTVNRRFFNLFDLPGSRTEVVGSDCERLAREVSDMFAESEQFVERIDDLVAARDPVDAEELSLADGRTFERTYRPVTLPDGDGHLWVYEEVTDRIEHEQRLEALNRATRELLSAETREEVAEIGVEVAKDALGLESNAIHLYDDDRDALVPTAVTQAVYDLVGDPPAFAPGESIAWRAYEGGEVLAVDDVTDHPDRYNPDTAIHSELYVPIAEDGILLAGSPSPSAFDEQDILLGEILSGNIAAALEQIDRTERLRTRETELTRQNDRLEQFASIVSHDLRNPLNVANARLELLAADCDSDHVPPIERAHDRMEVLIDDLLTLARHGETVTDREPVALSTLVDGCWATVETADATVVADVDRVVEADRGRLKQLFENLFRNAVEHGGEDVTVTVGELSDGFYVEDDGPGFADADGEDVFEPGYSTSSTGTGFGLTIVEQVVETHDWDIRVTAGADGGARFEITGVSFADE